MCAIRLGFWRTATYGNRTPTPKTSRNPPTTMRVTNMPSFALSATVKRRYTEVIDPISILRSMSTVPSTDNVITQNQQIIFPWRGGVCHVWWILLRIPVAWDKHLRRDHNYGLGVGQARVGEGLTV